jgi:hypothetical protein
MLPPDDLAMFFNDDEQDTRRRGPGRPTLSDDDLGFRRDTFARALETAWAEVGWALTRARSAVDIREALKPASLQGGSDRVIELLLRSERPLDRQYSLKTIRAQIGAAWQNVERLQRAHDQHRDSVREAQTAVSQADMQKLNPTLQIAVRSEMERRQNRFEEKDQEIKTATQKYYSWSNLLQRREGCYARDQLIACLEDKRYALTPLNFASAAAGLPFMAWRRSASRCRRIMRKSITPIRYSVFLAVKAILREKPPATKMDEWFDSRLDGLGKKHEEAQAYLKGSRPFLVNALQTDLRNISPMRRPYELTHAILQEIDRPRTDLEKVLLALGLSTKL